MVFFTCQHCGSSLQKNKVEKHYSFECRGSPNLTCVDCLKDFRGNEYVAHTACVTEEQRYGGKDFVAKTPSSVKKRATWLTSVEAALKTPGLSKFEKDFIQSCLQYSNIPQKRQKFHNFLKSSFGRNCPPVKSVDSIFDLLEKTHKENVEQEKLENANNNVTNNTKAENKKEETSNCDIDDDTKKKKKKRKHVDELVEGTSEVLTENISKENKKKKKNSKSQSFNENNEDGALEKSSSQLDESGDSSNKMETSNYSEIDDQTNNKDEKKLSKKERKEKRKREKYETELNEIKNFNKENCDDDENKMITEDSVEIEGDSKKKKKKKDKNKHVNGNDVSNETGNQKKRRYEETGDDEPAQKKSKTPDSNDNENKEDELSNSVSFKWDEMIIKVLESRSDKELPLNRLAKKLINEYYSVFGETHLTYEKLMSKFNKKVLKTPGVKVLRDRAKLVTC